MPVRGLVAPFMQKMAVQSAARCFLPRTGDDADIYGSHLIDFCAESVQVLTHKRGRHDIEPSRRTARKVGTEQAFL